MPGPCGTRWKPASVSRCRVAADVVFTLGASIDLASWQLEPALWERITTDTSGLAETVTYRLNESVQSRGQVFVRLAVAKAP